jgi:hypothetical protein
MAKQQEPCSRCGHPYWPLVVCPDCGRRPVEGVGNFTPYTIAESMLRMRYNKKHGIGENWDAKTVEMLLNVIGSQVIGELGPTSELLLGKEDS